MFGEAISICELTAEVAQGSIFEDIPCNDLADYKAKFETSISRIPTEILLTGITPLYGDLPKCSSVNATHGSADDSAVINLKCYAYLSISPFAENSIESIGLPIVQGIGFSGKISFLDKFEAVGEGKVCC